MIRTRAQFALLFADCLLLVAEHATHKPYQTQFPGFQCHPPSLNQFPLGRPGFGTHRCYNRLNELVPEGLIHPALFQAQ